MKYKKLFIGCLTALTLFTVGTYSQNTTAFAEETAVSGTYVSDSKEAIINRINEVAVKCFKSRISSAGSDCSALKSK